MRIGTYVNQYRKKTKKQGTKEAQEFVKLVVFLPVDSYEILLAESKKTGVKLSRLAAIAIDNELDTKVPFNYVCDVPDEVDEVGIGGDVMKVLSWLACFMNGVSLDTLVLCRRSLEMSKARLLDVVKYMLDRQWVELVQKNKYYEEKYPTIRVNKEAVKELKEKGLIK